MYTIKNKYGLTVTLPDTMDTRGNLEIERVLKEIGFSQEKENSDGLSYRREFFFDETGIRNRKYDFAILKHGFPCLLIEYDGEPHFDEDYYLNTGNRPERNTAHVLRTEISDAEKVMIAYQHGAVCVRLNKEHLKHLRDTIISYIEAICNQDVRNISKEVILIDHMEKYGWDFDYIPPSEPTKAEKERIERLNMDKERGIN